MTDAEVGSTLSCDECGEDLQITTLVPLELALADEDSNNDEDEDE